MTRSANDTVMPGRLRKFAPFDQLGSDQLILAAGRASLEHFRDSTAVVNCGANDPFDYFLLNGKLMLTDIDGNSQVIESDTGAASSAVATVRPSLYDVAAEGGVVCIKILRTEVDVFRDQLRRVNQANVAAVDDEDEDEDELCSTRSLILDLEEDIATERLQLPSAPELAMRIRRTVSKDNCTNQTIARLIAADPALAAKILKIANSPLCRGEHNISTLDDAVGRIGMHTVSELIVCFSLKDLFNSNIPSMRLKFAELVGESVRTGACASVIAGRSAPAFADQSLVAGLLSNLGALPILERLSQQPAFADNRGETDAILTEFTPRIGAMICETWDLGAPFAEATANARNWNYAVHGEFTLAEFVICARYHTLLALGRLKEIPAPETIKAMRVLGESVTPDVSLQIVKDTKARIVLLQDILA